MKTALFLLLACLLSFCWCYAELSSKEMKRLSQEGEKHLEAEIENAINGVQQMKRLMEKTEKEHEAYLRTLRETKHKKEEALKVAREVEQKLNQQQEVCNETMLALWEECKPCLKNTCIRYYSKICRSGSGLIGRQLDELLNRTSPLSIWINGERVDSLLKEDEQQGRRFEDLEEHYTVVENGVQDIFEDSMRVYENTHPFYRRPFFGGLGDFMRIPSFFQDFHFPSYRSRRNRDQYSLFHHDFHDIFHPLFERTQKMFDQVHRLMEKERQFHVGPGSSTDEGTVVSTPNGDDRMMCKEIRRNSAGCLQMSEKCEKCKEILSVDCSGKKPLDDSLRIQFEDAVRISERFSRQYDEYLKRFQEEMLNITSVLDRMNKEFGWVSRLANITGKTDGRLQVTTIYSKSGSSDDPSQPADTTVSVQLFDSPPMTFTVPGDIPWDDPKFMEIVAQEALERYKQSSVEA